MQVSFADNEKPWFYTVKKSDESKNFNLLNFAQKFNFDLTHFESLNGKITKISLGDVLVIPPSQKYFHVVMPTETISKIAKMYNTSEEKIKSVNKINKIFIGQKIFI